MIAYLYFPETRLKSLEEIAEAFGDEIVDVYGNHNNSVGTVETGRTRVAKDVEHDGLDGKYPAVGRKSSNEPSYEQAEGAGRAA